MEASAPSGVASQKGIRYPFCVPLVQCTDLTQECNEDWHPGLVMAEARYTVVPLGCGNLVSCLVAVGRVCRKPFLRRYAALQVTKYRAEVGRMRGFYDRIIYSGPILLYASASARTVHKIESTNPVASTS